MGIPIPIPTPIPISNCSAKSSGSNRTSNLVSRFANPAHYAIEFSLDKYAGETAFATGPGSALDSRLGGALMSCFAKAMNSWRACFVELFIS